MTDSPTQLTHSKTKNEFLTNNDSGHAPPIMRIPGKLPVKQPLKASRRNCSDWRKTARETRKPMDCFSELKKVDTQDQAAASPSVTVHKLLFVCLPVMDMHLAIAVSSALM